MKKWIVSALLAGLLTACSSNTADKTEPAPAPAAEPAPAPAPAEPAPAPAPAPEPVKEAAKAAPATSAADKAAPKTDAKPVNKPSSNLKPGLYAHFETTMGNFTAELNEKEAPLTSANFAGLASGEKEWTDPKTGRKVKKPFYDGLTFHRVIGKAKMPPNGFMIQGGDPLADGSGGPGFSIKDERNSLKHDSAGVLAMARTPFPDSAGSQFYITLGPQLFLDDGARVPDGSGRVVPYVVFGKVTEGLDVVTKIGAVQTDPGDKPLSPVTIKKITIERAK